MDGVRETRSLLFIGILMRMGTYCTLAEDDIDRMRGENPHLFGKA